MGRDDSMNACVPKSSSACACICPHHADYGDFYDSTVRHREGLRVHQRLRHGHHVPSCPPHDRHGEHHSGVDRMCCRTSTTPTTMSRTSTTTLGVNTDDYHKCLEEKVREKETENEVLRLYRQQLMDENDRVRAADENMRRELELLRRLPAAASASSMAPLLPPPATPPPPTASVSRTNDLGTLYICKSRGHCYHRPGCGNAKTGVPMRPCSVCFSTGA